MNLTSVTSGNLFKTICGLAALSAAIGAHAETWVQTGVDIFTGDAASSKGQGASWDAATSTWIFSSTNGLERTDAGYNRLQYVSPAIAPALANPSPSAPKGLNHIGDIDNANGVLYVSLDSSAKDADGNNYDTPMVALYDAKTFQYTGTSYALNGPHGVQDIASWVAVDATAGLGYGMAYDNATELTVYNLSDWSFKGYVALSHPLDQVQGGKLLGDWMYMSSDGDDKEIYRTNVKTGQVEDLFSLKTGDQEIEGLSFSTDAAGHVTLNVLNREYFPDDTSQLAFYHYALAPVPEPASGTLALAGLGIVAAALRRKATRRA